MEKRELITKKKPNSYCSQSGVLAKFLIFDLYMVWNRSETRLPMQGHSNNILNWPINLYKKFPLRIVRQYSYLGVYPQQMSKM